MLKQDKASNALLIPYCLCLNRDVPGKVVLAYGQRDDRSPANQDARQVAVGYFHQAWKNTTLYGVVGHLSNDHGGQLGIGYSPGFST